MLLAEAFVQFSGVTTLSRASLKKYRCSYQLLSLRGLKSTEDLSRSAVACFMDDLRAAGRSPKTVNGHLDALMSLLAHLERRGEVPQELLLALAGLRLKLPARRPPDYLSVQEFNTLRFAAPKIGRWLKLALEVAVFSGPRRGELRRLEIPEDVDFGQKLVRVHRKLYLGAEAGETKNRLERVVPMLGELAALMKDQAPMRGPLFPALHGRGSRYVSIEAMKHGMTELSRWTEIPCTWHKLRRTFVTWALLSGIDPRDVARWTGHSSLEVLLKHYGGYVRGYSAEIERLGTFMKANQAGVAS